MKKLLTISRVTEIGDVAERLVSLYKTASTLQDDANLKAMFLELEQKGTALTLAVKKSSVTSSLEDADAKRDQAIRVIDRLLKGYVEIPVETLKAHAKKLWEVFEKYGVKITSESYSNESNLINSLLTEFEASDLQPSITALSGMTEAIAELKTSQTHFAEVRKAYDQALSLQENAESASSLRKPVLELINKKIVPYLVAMKIVQAEKYKTFADETSQVIESVNVAVRVRK
ncbi:MAG: DUF6261 family protein [Bergeyella zoohelcum]|nr:DUF6261 family protein [Bergeyella zoohelcum]